MTTIDHIKGNTYTRRRNVIVTWQGAEKVETTKFTYIAEAKRESRRLQMTVQDGLGRGLVRVIR